MLLPHINNPTIYVGQTAQVKTRRIGRVWELKYSLFAKYYYQI
jgi:hypothetical protein